jgi:hypothetical protein
MKSPRARAATLALSLLLPLTAVAEPRVVDGSKPVKSKKRGVCANELHAADFKALSPSLTWWYSWFYKDTSNTPKDSGMTFLPMAWGDREDDLKGLEAYLRENKPPYVLAINEPNLKDQAFITPEQTAALYKKIKALADKKGIPVVGPHMALGSSENASITAHDPIENKKVTYTFMNPFLDATLHYLKGTDVTATAAHSYQGIGEMKWMVGMMHDTYKRPVWVTEFAWWDAPSVEAAREYLIQSVDLMENAPYVEGYAWFKERSDNPKMSLLEKEPGKLSILGETYVNMPVHDPDVYYQAPGYIPAESYVKQKGAELALTKDKAGGFLEMQAMGAGNTLDYNIAAPKTSGKATIALRFASAPGTKIEIYSGENLLGSVEATEKGWKTLSTDVSLPGGLQTIQLRPSDSVKLNWLEIK